MHKALLVAVEQVSALAAHRLGNKEALDSTGFEIETNLIKQVQELENVTVINNSLLCRLSDTARGEYDRIRAVVFVPRNAAVKTVAENVGEEYPVSRGGS